MPELAEEPLAGSLADALAAGPTAGARLFWLGQAGFVIEIAGRRLVIDPYLSDSLAEKYRDGPFPHERMMAPPVDPDGLGRVDLLLATHHHTDHMDAATLRPILASRPGLRLVAPAATLDEARSRSGLPEDRLIAMDAGDAVEPLPRVRIVATPAAHETLERDASGRHKFLGFLVEAGGLRIWHSGDCVPFDGLVDAVRSLRPDLALLPVNGRRPELAGRFAGNFSIAEAIEVAAAVGSPAMIAHHYGLFAFNTADPAAIDRAADTAPIRVVRARTQVCWRLG